MAKKGKRYKANAAKVTADKLYTLDEALQTIGGFEAPKFDESVEAIFNLGVDPKQSDQMVRGATVLPHGIGKKIRVVAIVKGEAEKEAKEAGADFVGSADLIEKIAGGWLDFDRVIATPDTAKELTKVARVLGPKGLMPNKKTGTVTDEVGRAVREQKLGTVNYKVEKAGILHAVVGKRSFGPDKLKQNFVALYDSVMKAKPSSSKGVYMRRAHLASTMGPSIPLDTTKLEGAAKEG